jgi:drug/metabolite transporter (DMT)-like permease
MTMLLIIAAILFFGLQTIALKKIEVTTLRENILETSLFSGIVAVGFWILTILTKAEISSITFWYGVLFGVVFIATITSYYYAMQTGPLSYTAFFYSASMVIPSLAGILIWNDNFGWPAGVGILLFLAAFYFITVPGAQKENKGNKKWMMLCFATWLLNGSLSVIVKAQQMAMKGTQASSMTTVAFTFACVFSLLIYFVLLTAKKERVTACKDFHHMRALIIILVAVALGNGGGSFTLTYLSSRVSSAYLFPSVLGGMMIGVTLYSVFVLKEKINKFGVIGIVFGVSALLMINL